MASFRIQDELKVKPKPTQQAPQANPLNSWMQFWSMIENTFKGKKGKGKEDWQNPITDFIRNLGTVEKNQYNKDLAEQLEIMYPGSQPKSLLKQK